MPSGIYKRTEEYKEQCSVRAKRLGYKPPSREGSTVSAEQKAKMSISLSKTLRGRHLNPATEFKVGHEGLKGDKSPLWKGGITNASRARVNTTEWRNTRKIIYKRDNWTCQSCKKHCRNSIQCHHIIPYDICRHNEHYNLVTLCKSCHIKIEHKTREALRVISYGIWLRGAKSK